MIKKIILDSVEYDYEASKSIEKGIHDENTAKATSVMNFLTEERPLMVCEGYSNVFQMYSDLLGLETYSKTGIMNAEDVNTKHAWNIVYINDKKMLVDLTNTEAGTVGYRGDLFMKEVEGTEYDILISGRNISYKENASK